MSFSELPHLIQQKIDAAKHFAELSKKRALEAKKRHIILASLIILGLIFSYFFLLMSPPTFFAKDTVITVEEGASLSEIALHLEEQHIIRSPFAFKVIHKLIFRNDRGIIAGDYVFEKNLSAYSVASRLSKGKYNLSPVRITIPEGLNKFELADLLSGRLSHFDRRTFIASAPEGYLFPDTYFFLPNADTRDVIRIMNNNFYEQIGTIREKIANSERNFEDIISMASIVETEARQTETRKIIAGILWNRLENDMPLQVDVSFKYINGKTTFDLTEEDLDIDSRYNSYKYTGLPPTPIANPGLDAILAALEPTETEYVFFLSDREGDMHYAETFDEHVRNKEKYLY